MNKPASASNGPLLVVVLAALGLALVAIPPMVANQIERVSRAGGVWLYVYIALVSTGGLLLVGCGSWTIWRLWRRSVEKRRRRDQRQRDPNQLSRREKRSEIQSNLDAVRDLQEDPKTTEEVRRELDQLSDRLRDKQQVRRLEIVAFGSISSGKSSLLNALAGQEVFPTDAKGGTTVRRGEVDWPGMDAVRLIDTPGLGEVDGEQHAEIATKAAADADLILMVVDGPLRDSEHQLLVRLGDMQKRMLICINKSDWYDRRDQQSLRTQIAQQTSGIAEEDDVVTVRSESVVRPRVRVTPEGGQVEEQVTEPPDIASLADRMMQVVRRDGQDLLLANLLLQSRGLVDEARQRVRDALDRRAWQIVDKYMWGAGGAAALSPFPLLDLLAGSAISAKMVYDLARVYRQDVDLDTAMNLVGQLGKQLIATLGVAAATPAVAAAVASLLKSIPGIGTIAGGTLQGLVVALVTRWIGAVFIAYFRDEMREGPAGLAETARRQWAFVTSADELRKLMRAAREHFKAK